jgi:hypothetical protein
LNAIALERRGEFDAMIARLSRGLERDIDWWVTWPATRNTHVSRLFTRCVQLTLIAELEDGGASLEIEADDAAFAKLLARGGKRRVRLRRRPQWKTSLHNIASSVLNSGAAWLAARTCPCKTPLPASIFAVEEGINEGSFIQGRKGEHYYPGLANFIAADDFARRHIVPVFYRVKSYRRLMRLIRRSDVPFLVREDYLGPADYLFALGHWWRVRRLLGRTESFAGFEVGSLIDADLRQGRFTNAAFQALLSYRFWRKVASAGVGVGKLLDWYEGHDRDHATAAAINWNRLPIRHVAYRHLTGPQYLGAIPTQHEVDAGVVPAHFAVAGKRAADDLRAELHGLKIYGAPSLRFAGLGAVTRQPKSPEVLVLLGLEQDFLRTVCDMLKPAFYAPQLSHLSWVLRAHPLTPLAMIASVFGGLPPNVRMSSASLRDDLSRATLATGVGTNALLEALVAGVPVISLAAGNEPMENPVPPWVDPALATVCYDPAEAGPLVLRMTDQAARVDPGALRTDIVGDGTMTGLRDALG